jgi:hypothetical protein
MEIPQAPPTTEDEEPALDAVTIEISDLEMTPHSSADNFFGDAIALVEGLGETAEGEWSSQVLVSEGPGQFVSLSSALDHTPIAMLSWDATDRARGALRVRSDGIIPIIAAAPASGEVVAGASIFLPDAPTTNERNRLAVTTLYTQSERLMTIAGEITVPWDTIEKEGGEALLAIDVSDMEGERRGRRVLPIRLAA